MHVLRIRTRYCGYLYWYADSIVPTARSPWYLPLVHQLQV